MNCDKCNSPNAKPYGIKNTESNFAEVNNAMALCPTCADQIPNKEEIGLDGYYIITGNVDNPHPPMEFPSVLAVYIDTQTGELAAAAKIASSYNTVSEKGMSFMYQSEEFKKRFTLVSDLTQERMDAFNQKTTAAKEQ